MHQWQNSGWPTKRGQIPANEQRASEDHAYAVAGAWMVAGAFLLGMGMREIFGGLLFVVRLITGGH